MRTNKNGRAFKLSIGSLVLIVALLIWASPSSAGGTAVADKRTEEKTQTIDLKGQTAIYVKNAKGTTKIVGKPDRTSIFVKATKVAKADNEKDVQALLDDLTYEVEQSDDKVSIITRYPGSDKTGNGILGFFSKFKRSAIMNYYIEVPASMNAEMSAASGDVGVAMLEGGAVVNCASGDVAVDQVGGNVVIELASGDVHVDKVGGSLEVTTASGDAYVASVGGDLSMRAASGDVNAASIGGDAHVSLMSGDLVIEGCKGSVTAESSSGDLMLLDIDGGIAADASSGDITVTILPDGKKEYNFNTASGDVNIHYYTPSDYGFLLEIMTGSGAISGDMVIKMETISRRHLKGVVGSGKAVVKVTTASGDVEVIEAKK